VWGVGWGYALPTGLTLSSAFNHCMALNCLLFADVPLRTYALTICRKVDSVAKNA